MDRPVGSSSSLIALICDGVHQEKLQLRLTRADLKEPRLGYHVQALKALSSAVAVSLSPDSLSAQ